MYPVLALPLVCERENGGLVSPGMQLVKQEVGGFITHLLQLPGTCSNIFYCFFPRNGLGCSLTLKDKVLGFDLFYPRTKLQGLL